MYYRGKSGRLSVARAKASFGEVYYGGRPGRFPVARAKESFGEVYYRGKSGKIPAARAAAGKEEKVSRTIDLKSIVRRHLF